MPDITLASPTWAQHPGITYWASLGGIQYPAQLIMPGIITLASLTGVQHHAHHAGYHLGITYCGTAPCSSCMASPWHHLLGYSTLLIMPGITLASLTWIQHLLIMPGITGITYLDTALAHHARHHLLGYSTLLIMPGITMMKSGRILMNPANSVAPCA